MAISFQVHGDLRKASVKQKRRTWNLNNTLEFDRHFGFSRTIRESQASIKLLTSLPVFICTCS